MNNNQINFESIKENLKSKAIFVSEERISNKPTVIGYDKKFKWGWFATQLNTFIVVSDFGDEKLTVDLMENHLSEAFEFAQKNYTGWPRGLQSGLGVISILMSKNVTSDVSEYCRELKAGKKWAGFSVPVVVNSSTNELDFFEKNPIWGMIYYPYLKKMILEMTG